MKKYFMIFAATLVSFVACQEEIAPSQEQEKIENGDVEIFDYPVKVTFDAGSEDVKTSINDTKVLWENGDAIKVIWSEDGYNKAIAEPYNDNKSASFTTSVEEAEDYYAVHPYDAESSYSNGNIVVTIPAVQGGAFADANISVAKATEDNVFRFKHLVGMICFTTDVPGKVVISGVEDDVLTGVVTITGFNEDGTPVYDEDKVTKASNSIEIDAKASGTYYAAFLPSAKLTYLSIKVGEEDAVQYALSANQMQMARGKIWDLGNISPRLGKNLFVTPDGTSVGDGKTWETAMSYQQMAVMMAWNRDAIEKDASILVSTAGPAANTEGREIHNTVHADQMDGITFHLAEGTYKPTAYIRMSWEGLDRKVNIKVLGGYSASAKGTDLSKKGGETIIDSKDITKTTRRPFYIKDNINILFKNITFKGGLGDAEHGGGAFFILPASGNTPSVLTCNNCKFKENTSNSRGVIYQFGAGDVNLNDCEFVGNKAKTYGASVAMLTANGVLSANRCKFTGNGLENSSDNNCYGGALFIEGTAELNDCEFEANYIKNTAVNKAADAEAGTKETIYFAEGGSVCGTSSSNITISKSSFKDGYTEDAENDAFGGEIYTSGKLAISNTKFERTSSRVDAQAYKGGAIFLAAAELSLLQTSLTNNLALYNGGAVYIESGSKLTATDCTFTGNEVTDLKVIDCAGGAVYSSGNTSNSMVLTDCDFINNVGGSFGGAVACYSPNPTVIGCNFVGNKTTYRKSGAAYGGALYLSNKATDGIISSSTFTDNYAQNSAGEAYGGAIYVNTDCSATVSNSVFSRSGSNKDNLAKRGGAIGVNGATITLNGNTVQNCAAENHGGALYAQNSATMVINGSTLNTNSSNTGGAISVYKSTLTVENNTVISNSSSSSHGAAIYADESIVSIYNSSLSSNKITADGGSAGALYCKASPGVNTIDGVTIDGCTSKNHGGAIYFGNPSGTLIMKNSVIRNCTSTAYAGALYITSAGVVADIENTSFENNYGATRGGAICQGGNESICKINGCSFVGNYADKWGGALATSTSGKATYYVNNSIFRGNYCKNNPNGTALFVRGGYAGLNNCSFYDNHKSTSSLNYTSDLRFIIDQANGVGGIVLNSTIINSESSTGSCCISDANTDNVTGAGYTANANSKVFIMNNLLASANTSVSNFAKNGATYYEQQDNHSDSNLASFTQVGDNPWFTKTGLTASVKVSDIKEKLQSATLFSGLTNKKTFGTDFLSWLNDLTVKAGDGTAKGALDYDIAGNARGTEAYVPGCYQGPASK